ncbi:helix-turn-helix domain-containing protein [Terrisporobacter sp.]|uniref:helix-turn-helix domain-containing protein n=1 Tax=Terrisporobacter sp. TaxID=1965305 RepID=UPI0028A1A9E2|nr:helix-turn-helix domain-containing protein [Terrisporobacter sp.]
MGRKIKRKYKLKPLYVLDGNFTQIANTMFKHIPNGNYFKIYCYLCFRYNRNYQYAFPSLNTISKDTIISVSTVQKAINWLEQKKFIVRYKRKESEWMNNCYYVRYVVENNEDDQKEIIKTLEQELGDGFETEIEIEIEEEVED